MKHLKTTLTTALILAALSGCQQVGDVLDGANTILSGVNNVLSGQPTTTGNNNAAVMTSSTRNSISQALSRAVPDRDTAPLFNDAKPAIANYIGLIACGASSARLQRYSAPGTQSGNLALPHGNMEHHTGGCLRILRVNNIRKLAANALSFDVYYMSPQSEEVVRRTHRAIKQPDGEWLFNFYGW
jgi:hypothetical protein